MLHTAKICKKAGLTYDGFAIGLPEEYYKKNYPKEYLMGKIDATIKRLLKKDNERMRTEVDTIACEEALKRFRL